MNKALNKVLQSNETSIDAFQRTNAVIALMETLLFRTGVSSIERWSDSDASPSPTLPSTATILCVLTIISPCQRCETSTDS
jgi:hypothetical protein|tara:strand:+ start:295 stop:537 length:243 start_codon:yes stop_codon:yes gene_type:complete